jgi:hypothetical protein
MINTKEIISVSLVGDLWIEFDLKGGNLIQWKFKNEKDRDDTFDEILIELNSSAIKENIELLKSIVPEVMEFVQNYVDNLGSGVDPFGKTSQMYGRTDPETFETNDLRAAYPYLEPLRPAFFMANRSEDVDGMNDDHSSIFVSWLDNIQTYNPGKRELSLTNICDLYYLSVNGKTEGIRIAAGVIFEQERKEILRKKNE